MRRTKRDFFGRTAEGPYLIIPLQEDFVGNSRTATTNYCARAPNRLLIVA